MTFGGKSLPLDAWPKSDRRAWQEATQKGGLLDDGGRASHMAEKTITDLTRRYARFLGFVAHEGMLLLDRPPAANVTPDNVSLYISHLKLNVRSVTVQGSVAKAIRVAKLIAPNGDFGWTRPVMRRLAFEAHPKDKRSRVVDSARLYALGVELIESSRTYSGKAFIRNASTYRDGLMIALLALCPLRLANFASLTLEKSLLHIEDGWVISISPDDSKSGRHIEMLLPDELAGHLELFLRSYRVRYPNQEDTNALWLSTYGPPLKPGSISRIVSQRTRFAFGHAVNAHLFRDCAATTVAVRAGSKMGVAVALLAHRSQRTIDKHYNQANMISAVQAYHRHLDLPFKS